MASYKKRKVDTEGKMIKKSKLMIFTVLIKDNPVCLMCKESETVMKRIKYEETLLNQTFKILSSQYQLRNNKIKFEKGLTGQHALLLRKGW
jgi:hypothetical protein